MFNSFHEKFKSINLKVIFLFLTFFLALFYIIFNDYEGHNSNYKLIVLIIFFLNFCPFIYFFLKTDEQNIIPIFYITLIYFFFSYTFFYLFDIWNVFGQTISGAIGKTGGTNYADVYKSLEIFLIGLSALNLGFFSVAFFFKKKRSGFEILKIKSNQEVL
ncbi:hypothetical protein IDH07_04540, partial [Pelagibacterales bacterium SAG-MED04]|nr:hypothetical protein [Pelagibacterales bacterium SAG-MED04]